LPSMLEINTQEIFFFALLVFFVFGFLCLFYYINWLRKKGGKNLCPYTGKPLRKAHDLPSRTQEKVIRYLYDLHDYYNRIFDFNKAAFCRETGRIFPNAVNALGVIDVDWSFLQKRFPGHFVSWGSLTPEQQLIVQEKHGSLKDFQIDESSPKPRPMDVDLFFAYSKPGPLYVDIETKVLLGWKEVPETDLEVLIVQKPRKIYIPGVLEG